MESIRNRNLSVKELIIVGLISFQILIYMLLPGYLNLLKIIISVAIVIFSLLTTIAKKKLFRSSLLLSVIIFIGVSTFFLITSFLNGYPIDSGILQIYIFTPLIVYLIANIMSSKNMLIMFFKLLQISCFIILTYNIVYMIGEITPVPQLFFWEENVSVVSQSFLSIRLTNQASLMFLLPMNYTNLFFENKVPYNKKLTLLNSILGLVVTILSGRRALQIVVISSIILIWILSLLMTKNFELIKKILKTFLGGILGFILLLGLSRLLGLSSILSSMTETILNAFSSTESSTIVRDLQKELSIKFWQESPFIGHGLTSHIPNYIRSGINYWSYEQFYYALLFQTGLVGIIYYGGILVSILKFYFSKAVKFGNLKNRYFYLSLGFGVLMFSFAASSNPMITSLWPWVIITLGMDRKLFI